MMEQKTIKVSKKNQVLLKNLLYEENVAKRAFKEAARMMENSSQELWKKIEELYPEIISLRGAVHNQETHEIRYSVEEED